MPALLALLVSMAFTVIAVGNPNTGEKLALPVAIVAVLLMAWQARKDRSEA